MHTSSNGRKLLIEDFEGCFLEAYDDYNDKILKVGDVCRGTLSIGFGHTNAAGLPTVYIGQVISRSDADSILSNDLLKVEQQVSSLVKVPLNQNQFDALVSFQFNTGALANSSALRLLNNGDYTSASDHLLLYNKDHQISPDPLPGLVRRRNAEATLFNTPIITQTSETKPNDLLSSIFNIILSFWRNWLLRRSGGN